MLAAVNRRVGTEKTGIGELHLVDQLPDHEIRIVPQQLPAERIPMREQRAEVAFLTGDRAGMPEQSVDRVEVGESERLLRTDVPVGVEALLFDQVLHAVPVGDRGDHQEDSAFFTLIDQVIEDAQIGIFHELAGGICDLPFVHVQTEEIRSEQLQMIQIGIDCAQRILSQFRDVVEIVVEGGIVIDAPEGNAAFPGVKDFSVPDMERRLKRKSVHRSPTSF